MFLFTMPMPPIDGTLPANSIALTPRRVTFANESEDKPAKPNTFWILGPFGVEHQLGPNTSAAVYLTGYYARKTSDGFEETETKIGLSFEALRYSSPGASGLGYGARATIGDGFVIGPSLFYVTRPSGKGVAFRVGATFPFGNDAIPFSPELAIGFRF